jgi:hydroxymethylglutaryl-CoA synthase
MLKDVMVGIDDIAFYTSGYMLDLGVLAAERGIDPQKFYVGLGQRYMAVPSPDEDVITMGANAAQQLLGNIDLSTIALLIVATESSVDQSKSAGIYIHQLLHLSPNCRVVEMKQACYAGTCGLQLAMPFLRAYPQKKVLLIASDIARYGLATPGEASQGCGAVAMLLGVEPQLLAIDAEYGVVSENIMDFWRPNYLDVALVDGKYSSKMYLQMLSQAWLQYSQAAQRNFSDHHYYCYHTPFVRLAEKAHNHLYKFATATTVDTLLTTKQLLETVQPSLHYIRQVGNCYTAALYLAFISLLDHANEGLAGKRIGFYSYGSGCVAEFFSGVVQPGYQQLLHKAYHHNLLATRYNLSYQEYLDFYHFPYPKDGSTVKLPPYSSGKFRLAQLARHQRDYESKSAS